MFHIAVFNDRRYSSVCYRVRSLPVYHRKAIRRYELLLLRYVSEYWCKPWSLHALGHLFLTSFTPIVPCFLVTRIPCVSYGALPVVSRCLTAATNTTHGLGLLSRTPGCHSPPCGSSMILEHGAEETARAWKGHGKPRLTGVRVIKLPEGLSPGKLPFSPG